MNWNLAAGIIGLLSFLYVLFLLRKKLDFGKLTILSLLLGVFFGIVLQTFYTQNTSNLIVEFLNFIGGAYVQLLQMLVVPLVFFSILYTILQVQKTDLKQIGLKIVFILLLTTAIATLIGILFAYFFNVPQKLPLLEGMENLFYEEINPKALAYKGILATFLDLIPKNLIQAMYKNNVIGIIIFAILLGVSAMNAEEKYKEEIQFFRKIVTALFVIIKKVVVYVLKLTPYGVFALIASIIAKQGLQILWGTIHFIVVLYLACFLMLLIHLLILSTKKINPIKYIEAVYPVLVLAFTSRSSAGTLPFTIETMQKKLNVPENTATLAASFGSNMGMNACAGIFPGMVAIVALYATGQTLDIYQIIKIELTILITSLGIAGVPGAASIALAVSLSALGFDFKIIAPVLGSVLAIDPILDMIRTATNVNGAIVAGVMSSKSSKLI